MDNQDSEGLAPVGSCDIVFESKHILAYSVPFRFARRATGACPCGPSRVSKWYLAFKKIFLNHSLKKVYAERIMQKILFTTQQKFIQICTSSWINSRKFQFYIFKGSRDINSNVKVVFVKICKGCKL